MWILPKNLIISPFVQDTAALILDLQELSKVCEPSLTVRSNFTQSKTLLTRWKKESSRPLLFGRTLKLSHSKSFVAAWISSLGVSHANLFQVPDEETAIQTQDTYFPLSSKESLIQDLPLFSWKMSEESSAQNSNQTNGLTPKIRRFCYMSLESWKESVMSAIGAYSQREKQAFPILGKESLSWEKEQILQILGLKSFPSTFMTVVKTSHAHSTAIELVYANQQITMIRGQMGQVTQPSYYKRLLSQLLALKESNPQAFARLAVEIENNNSLNPLELLEKTWATPSTSEAQMTQTPSQIIDRRLRAWDMGDHKQRKQDMLTHQVTMNEWNTSEQIKTWTTPTKSDSKDVGMTTPIKEHASIDRTDSKMSRQIHLEAMNEQIKTWATPAKGDQEFYMRTPEYIQRQLDKSKQDTISMQALRSDTNKSTMTWATPAKRDHYDMSYSPEALMNRLDKGHQDSTAMQALRSNKHTFTELRTMREQALAKPESERTPEEIRLLTYREMLNPRWVEMLMGLPIGWTMKNCATVIQVSWMK